MTGSKTTDRELGLRQATNIAKAIHQRFGIQRPEHINVPAIAKLRTLVPPDEPTTVRAFPIRILYVHVAEAHARELPEPVREMSVAEIEMLGARARVHGSQVAAKTEVETKNAAVSAA